MRIDLSARGEDVAGVYKFFKRALCVLLLLTVASSPSFAQRWRPSVPSGQTAPMMSDPISACKYSFDAYYTGWTHFKLSEGYPGYNVSSQLTMYHCHFHFPPRFYGERATPLSCAQRAPGARSIRLIVFPIPTFLKSRLARRRSAIPLMFHLG